MSLILLVLSGDYQSSPLPLEWGVKDLVDLRAAHDVILQQSCTNLAVILQLSCSYLAVMSQLSCN